MPDYDQNCRYVNGPGTPTTPKSFKNPPQVVKHMLDAPNVVKDLPAKVIDMNDNNEIAVALGTNVYIWKENKTHLLMEGNIEINGVCWVGNDLAISGEGHVELWDVRQQEAFREFYDHQNRAVALSSVGGTRFATGGADGIVCMFDVRTDRHNLKIASHQAEVCALSWSPDGSMLSSGGDDANVYVYDGKRKLKIRHEAPVHALSWMNSSILVTGDVSNDGLIQLFHTRSEDRRRQVKTGAPISGLCVTEKWGILASHGYMSGSWDIWTHDLSRKLADYQSHRDEIINITANTEGSLVATISADETLQIYQLAPSVLTPSQQSKFVASGQIQSPRCTPGSSRNNMHSNTSHYGYPRSPGFSCSPFGLR